MNPYVSFVEAVALAPPLARRRLAVRLAGLLVAGLLAGMAATAIIQGWTSGHPGSFAWIALGYMGLLVVGSGVILGSVITPRRTRPRPPQAPPGEIKTLSGVVHAAGAEELRVEITLTHGSLYLAGGAEPALSARFQYDDADWLPPFVRYLVNGRGQGRVLLSQRSTEREGPGQGYNAWSLQLNDQTPIDLAVRIGDGQGKLDLRGLDLTWLDVWPGAGDLTLDLGGEWKRSLKARVHAGLGKVTICLPAQVGVLVTTGGRPGGLTSTDGLLPDDRGGLVNAAYATSPVTLDVAIDTGLGQVILQSVDCA